MWHPAVNCKLQTTVVCIAAAPQLLLLQLSVLTMASSCYVLVHNIRYLEYHRDTYIQVPRSHGTGTKYIRINNWYARMYTRNPSYRARTRQQYGAAAALVSEF